MGDVLWRLALLLDTAGLTLGEVLEANTEKLTLRYPNGFSAEASRGRRD